MVRTAKDQDNPAESEAAADFHHDSTDQAVPEGHEPNDGAHLAETAAKLSAEDLDALVALDHEENQLAGDLRQEWDSAHGYEAVADDAALFAEYDSDLRQPAYDLATNPLDHRELKLDRFLAGLPDASSRQREEIAGILREFSPARLRKWLPWLEKQQWTGDSLTLLLEFHEQWMTTPEWWECSWWDSRLTCWVPYSTSSTLSRSGLLYLVQRRLNFPPSGVIDDIWLMEWRKRRLWERGFYTFASFALFRASIADEEDWVARLPPSEIRKTVSDASAWDLFERPTTVSGHYDPTNLSEWFAMHDWYDSREWNDGLGI